VFSYEGPHLLGYTDAGISMQSSEPTIGGTLNATLSKLIQFLQAPAGILFISTHGGENSTVGGFIAVEAYPGTADGHQAAVDARAAYINAGIIDASEMYVGDAGGYTVLNVTSAFLQRKVGNHSIVFVAACYSSALGDAFINSNHQVRNFIGVSGRAGIDWFSDGRAIGQVLFNDMAGTRNDGGVYRNQSIAAAFPYVQAAVSAATLFQDGAAPSAGNLRLYNAPRIVKAQVTQDMDDDGTYEHSLYSLDFGNYPYNPGNSTDYPSGGSPTSGVGGSKPIKVLLHFSARMNNNFSDFYVNLLGSDGTRVNIPGTWSSGYFTNDTWSGTVNIPENFPDGETRIAVRAKRISASDSDFYNQELDLDGDGSSALGAESTSVNFNPFFVFSSVV